METRVSTGTVLEVSQLEKDADKADEETHSQRDSRRANIRRKTAAASLATVSGLTTTTTTTFSHDQLQ